MICIREKTWKNASPKTWSILVKKVPNLVRGGKIILDDNGVVVDIVEGNNHGGGEGLVNAEVSRRPEIFGKPLVKIPGREEFGLPQTLLQMIPEIKLKIVEATGWHSLTDKSDIERTEREFLQDR